MRFRFYFVFQLVFGAALSQTTSHLQNALLVEKWIHGLEQSTTNGIWWPAISGDSVAATSLYSGTQGVILFYLELYYATRQQRYLQKAQLGADLLIHATDKQDITYDEVGLYTGLAGTHYTLNRVFELSRDDRYRLAAQNSLRRLKDLGQHAGNGISWRYTDIVYGSAGIGLTLLNGRNSSEEISLAAEAGNGLIAQGITVSNGIKWYMDTSLVRLNYYMPNFSHGTAGVSYFLVKLYEKTKDNRYLEAALKGASHLESLENKDFWIYHHDRDDGKDLYYLSWCHGPAGTARLYYALYNVTKDKKWLTKVKQSATALMQCGIPEKQTPGFWNNVGPCCGSAGVAEFFLDLHRVLGDEEYLTFSKHVTENLLTRSTVDDQGMRWIQSEHRRQPNLLQAQTGYMQGASGIGIWFLQMHAFERKYKPFVNLPDNPFREK
jgi:lantibiotic modifying enzyme